ncbi:MAG: NUDIX hydrolase [Flavobacteriales bacterium CG_4_8_14_3_um_filter_35_10]|nr:MAG: NUDIX hydrolase [Flavobacteriales bacterium CG_4_8_14_3_um_filter_35_10]
MTMPLITYQTLHPGLSIDCVIFGFYQKEIKVLVLKLKNFEKWSLPGGFVDQTKDVDDEATNILKRRTGLKNVFLRQFHLFGDVKRNSDAHINALFNSKIIDNDSLIWFKQRFVTVGYYALIPFSPSQIFTPDNLSESCEWRSLKDIPEMILDHKEIIDFAHKTLKKELNYQPIGLNLLPEQFTMSELQAVYETILEKPLDRRNFRRKILNFAMLIPTKKQRVGGAYRSPYLYQFDLDKYHLALQNGLSSGW